MEANHKLVGKEATVINPSHTDYKNWGLITSWDGEYFHVAMNNDVNATLLFERSELQVRRGQ